MQGSSGPVDYVYRTATGKELTLVFSPDGVLSKAELEGYDVTRDLRYLRESDHADALVFLGFRKDITRKETQIAVELGRRFKKTDRELYVVDVVERGDGNFDVSLSSEDPGPTPHRLVHCKFVLCGKTFRSLQVLRMYNCSFVGRLNSYLHPGE